MLHLETWLWRLFSFFTPCCLPHGIFSPLGFSLPPLITGEHMSPDYFNKENSIKSESTYCDCNTTCRFESGVSRARWCWIFFSLLPLCLNHPWMPPWSYAVPNIPIYCCPPFSIQYLTLLFWFPFRSSITVFSFRILYFSKFEGIKWITQLDDILKQECLANRHHSLQLKFHIFSILLRMWVMLLIFGNFLIDFLSNLNVYLLSLCNYPLSFPIFKIL